MIPNSLVEKTKEFLGADGMKFFVKVKEKHGRVNAIWVEGGIPHPVHFREGMQIRNFMRNQIECVGWGDHDFDNNWVELIELCIVDDNGS